MTLRRRRILRAALTFVGVLAVGAVLVYFVILPWIVRNRVKAVLRAQGLEAFSFHVPVATLRRAMMTDLKVGDGENHIDRLIVQYSMSSLRQGRLDSIRVEGMNLVASVGADGTINLGPLAPLLKRAGTKPTTQPTEPTVLPADRIELASSQLIVKSATNSTQLPLSGTAIRSDDSVKIDFRTELGSPMVLTGNANPTTGDVHLTLAADDVDARALTRLATALVPGLSFGLQGRLKAQGGYTRENGKGSLDAELTATSATTQPSPADPNVQLTSGVLHLAGAFGPEGSSMKISIKDASLTERSQSMEIAGIHGDVQLTGFAPLSSPPAQRVQVAQAKVGELTLKDGIVEFQVIGPQSIQIQHTQWNTLGGQVLANNATIQNGNVTATLQAKQVDLEQVLSLFAKDKAAGKGSLSGDIQIAYTNGLLHVLSGELTSTSTGTLQIKDAESIAGQVSQGLSKGTAQEQAKAQLIQSLKDFQFTQITGALQREPSGLVARIRIRGHGRTGAKVPILYDLNLFGLEPVIRSTLRLREALSTPHNAQGKALP
jgi:hypothetical protein